ncbi:MAG: hypothetical protein KDJ50_06885 [Alphaproteobacteria bacterium]|nr:hypothetical protein [Alphaproteobacteria bacterium]
MRRISKIVLFFFLLCGFSNHMIFAAETPAELSEQSTTRLDPVTFENVCRSDKNQCRQMIAGFMQGMEMTWDLLKEEGRQRENIFCLGSSSGYIDDIRDSFFQAMQEQREFSEEQIYNSISLGPILAVGLHKYLCRRHDGIFPNEIMPVDLSLDEMQVLCTQNTKLCRQILQSMMQGMEFAGMMLTEDSQPPLYCLQDNPDSPDSLDEMRLKFLDVAKSRDHEDHQQAAILAMQDVFSPHLCPLQDN